MRSIAIYLILDALIGIIMPTSKYKKYISLVSGFILVLIMLAPISKFYKLDPENIKKILEVKDF